MKNVTRLYRKSSLALAMGLLSMGVASAATVSIGDATGLVGGGATTPAVLPITFQGDGVTVGYQATLTFDPVALDAATQNVGTGLCVVNQPAGTITVLDGTADNSPLGDVTTCNVTFTIDAGALDGDVYALDINSGLFSDANAMPSPGPHTENDGQITISNAPPVPPTVTFAPNGGPINLTAPGGALQGALSNASVIAITAVGGSGAGVGSYNCVVDPGAPFDVSNLADANVAVGDDPADMSVICTLGAAAVAANMNCTRTGGDATPVNFALTCPAGVPVPAPAYSSSPAPGAELTCNGQPGALTQTSVTITNTGLAGVNSELDYNCSTASAGFSVISGAAGFLAVGANATVTVQCTVPAEGDPAATGTLDCTHNAGNENSPVRYPLSAAAITAPPPVPQPNVVPASSLWSQLSLIGLLAALGLLVVGIRRNH